MGNRLLRAAGIRLEVLGADDFRQASVEEQSRSIALDPAAVWALEQHTWPGNFRELESVLERALLLYRRGGRLGADDIARALDATNPGD
jgi:DNA-binding NtrC family response regulator